MSKERLMAFTDAILAIIMTILVLELERPASPDWKAIWELRGSFFSYALSFFWLGAMWINLHNQWQKVDMINNRVVWWNLIMLFFSSVIPYVTDFVGRNFMSAAAQGFYGLVVLMVSLSNIMLSHALEKANPHDQIFVTATKELNRWMWYDIAVKSAGLIIAMLFYPPVAIFSIIVASFIPSLKIIHIHKKYTGEKL